MKTIRKSSTRAIVQLAIIIIVLGGALLRSLRPQWSLLLSIWPELQGFCPFGGVHTITRVFFDPAYLLSAQRSNLWVFLGVFLITLLFGTVFCSTLCPLGTIQEWIGTLGKRLRKKRYNPSVSKQLDSLLSSIRYILLFLLVISFSQLLPWNTDLINPSYVLVHVWTKIVPITAVILVLFILALSFFFERPWCRWACPYGLVLGFVSIISFWKVERVQESCITCKKCDRLCPFKINISSVERVTSRSCNRCLSCIQSCNIPNAIRFSGPKGKLSISRSTVIVPLLTLILFFSPYGIARISGWYQVQSSQSVIQQSFSVEDLHPMMSLSDVAVRMNISEEELLSILELPSSFDTQILLIDVEEEDDYWDYSLSYMRALIQAYVVSK